MEMNARVIRPTVRKAACTAGERPRSTSLAATTSPRNSALYTQALHVSERRVDGRALVWIAKPHDHASSKMHADMARVALVTIMRQLSWVQLLACTPVNS